MEIENEEILISHLLSNFIFYISPIRIKLIYICNRRCMEIENEEILNLQYPLEEKLTKSSIFSQRKVYRSSSSAGRAVSWASLMSFSIFCCQAGSMVTSGGTRAGMATNSRLGSPINFLANQRKGFSKL